MNQGKHLEKSFFTQIHSHGQEDNHPEDVVEDSDKVHNGDDNIHNGRQDAEHNIAEIDKLSKSVLRTPF